MKIKITEKAVAWKRDDGLFDIRIKVRVDDIWVGSITLPFGYKSKAALQHIISELNAERS